MSPLRIAVWSGPRNISTAMMRSFGNRPDCYVTDEPLYAHYLASTGLQHPGRAETLAHHEVDWRTVADWLTGPIPEGKGVWYQKHMAHHLLPHIERNWLNQLVHCFLIRHPREMVASLAEFLPEPSLRDTGLPQQVELFHSVCQRCGEVPPIVDARDVLKNPRSVLGQLCQRLGLSFCDEMLHWPAGPRPSDGAWGAVWYGKVYATTGFGTYRSPDIDLSPHLESLVDQCLPLYDTLSAARIRPSV